MVITNFYGAIKLRARRQSYGALILMHKASVKMKLQSRIKQRSRSEMKQIRKTRNRAMMCLTLKQTSLKSKPDTKRSHAELAIRFLECLKEQNTEINSLQQISWQVMRLSIKMSCWMPSMLSGRTRTRMCDTTSVRCQAAYCPWSGQFCI